jgi:hypothetical protein
LDWALPDLPAVNIVLKTIKAWNDSLSKLERKRQRESHDQ